METSELVADEFFTEAQVLAILGIAASTLNARISRGTDHPPFQKLGTERYYPKRMFFEWAAKKPVIWAVKDAS